jgi:hypothetical protein
MQVCGQLPGPAALLPVEEPLVLIGREVGLAPRAGLEAVGYRKKILFLPGVEPRPFSQ